MPKGKGPTAGAQYVYLMGGLGNQLFQISAGLYSSGIHNRNLLIDETFENYRKNSNLAPDFRTFRNSEMIACSFKDKKVAKFGRVLGLLTRLSLMGHSSLQQRFYVPLLRIFMSMILSISRLQRVKVWSSSNLGYVKIPDYRNSQFLIGYFQSYRFASDPSVREKLNTLTVESAEVDDLARLAILERPLVVHIRLGDYRQESKFGTLGIEYYSRAIADLFDVQKYGRIWVFSDEIDRARLLIEDKYLEYVRWFPDINEPAAVTLEKMRLGHAYIIGNSTFSWWGAFLSKVADAPTIAPIPWFTGLQEPVDLIPPNWKRLERELN